MAVRRDNVISIALLRLFNVGFLFNQVATQFSSRDWMDPLPDLIHL
jgi:hypothetical protein